MNPVLRQLGRRLRLGVVGGGAGSFIGPVHRTAARLDDRFEVVAGVLSSDAERSRAQGVAIGLAPERAYADWRTMLETERARPDGIDVVAVMTPNHLHFPVADAALDAGFDVVCDKPLAMTSAEAIALVRKVAATGLVFCTTYNYSQYPMVRQARALVASGRIGAVRQIHLEYVQGHAAARDTAETAAWRHDPARSGQSLILGDIGTHAQHLGAYVSGLDLEAVLAELATTVPGRASDDYAALLLHWAGGALG
ncbi:MAG: Gfo/Idh/MocA family oxidoreductase, partial [Nocardioides sp.]